MPTTAPEDMEVQWRWTDAHKHTKMLDDGNATASADQQGVLFNQIKKQKTSKLSGDIMRSEPASSGAPGIGAKTAVTQEGSAEADKDKVDESEHEDEEVDDDGDMLDMLGGGFTKRRKVEEAAPPLPATAKAKAKAKAKGKAAADPSMPPPLTGGGGGGNRGGGRAPVGANNPGKVQKDIENKLKKADTKLTEFAMMRRATIAAEIEKKYYKEVSTLTKELDNLAPHATIDQTKQIKVAQKRLYVLVEVAKAYKLHWLKKGDASAYMKAWQELQAYETVSIGLEAVECKLEKPQDMIVDEIEMTFAVSSREAAETDNRTAMSAAWASISVPKLQRFLDELSAKEKQRHMMESWILESIRQVDDVRNRQQIDKLAARLTSFLSPVPFRKSIHGGAEQLQQPDMVQLQDAKLLCAYVVADQACPAMIEELVQPAITALSAPDAQGWLAAIFRTLNPACRIIKIAQELHSERALKKMKLERSQAVAKSVSDVGATATDIFEGLQALHLEGAIGDLPTSVQDTLLTLLDRLLVRLLRTFADLLLDGFQGCEFEGSQLSTLFTREAADQLRTMRQWDLLLCGDEAIIVAT